MDLNLSINYNELTELMEVQTDYMKKEIESLFDSIDFDHIEKHPHILIAAGFWDDRF